MPEKNYKQQKNNKHQKNKVLSGIEEVFVKSETSLKRWVSRFLNRPQDVEDIVQETFVRSYQAQVKQQIDNPSAYLFRTARNLAFKSNQLSANKLTDLIEDLDLPEVITTDDPVQQWASTQEQFSAFCDALRELPVQCRRVFVLKKIYGLSHDEIAERLGISVSTANQHLAKGIARCTAYMRKNGMLESRAVKTKTPKSGKVT
jgi:RNA polymerase sigma factor (sigma-70 family)